MKILLAPLNWGLGHASRCVPLVRRFMEEGNEVILGGDGDSLTLLRKHFPKLRYVYLAPLRLQYSQGRRQVFAMIKALPKILVWAIKDHAMLKAVLREEHIDRIVSDNRFGLYCSHPSECIYITHQLHIFLPKGWKWLEPLAEKLHARVYSRFNKVWVPDYADPDQSLAGDMSHPQICPSSRPQPFEYIGPLSRFADLSLRGEVGVGSPYDVVAVLSGLEPHRTLLEREILTRYAGAKERVLLVQGLPSRPNTCIKRGNITMVPYMKDTELADALRGAKRIIARSGYSTIMDLEALGLLNTSIIELIPTPGQPEQEYLAAFFEEKKQKNA